MDQLHGPEASGFVDGFRYGFQRRNHLIRVNTGLPWCEAPIFPDVSGTGHYKTNASGGQFAQFGGQLGQGSAMMIRQPLPGRRPNKPIPQRGAVQYYFFKSEFHECCRKINSGDFL